MNGSKKEQGRGQKNTGGLENTVQKSIGELQTKGEWQGNEPRTRERKAWVMTGKHR